MVVVDMHGRPGKYIKKEERDKSDNLFIKRYIFALDCGMVIVIALAINYSNLRGRQLREVFLPELNFDFILG